MSNVAPFGTPGVSLCLHDEEIRELTGKQKYFAQVKVLRFMAMDHRRRPDGSIVVLRSSLAPNGSAKPPVARTQPNWN
jgi:hypothetical protein